jgi:hypothetical protein
VVVFGGKDEGGASRLWLAQFTVISGIIFPAESDTTCVIAQSQGTGHVKYTVCKDLIY